MRVIRSRLIFLRHFKVLGGRPWLAYISCNSNPPDAALITEPVYIRKGLSLYKQPKRKGSGSPYWYARAFMRIGNKAVHTKSTGTTDIREATKRAEDLWAECLLRSRYGNLPNTDGSADQPVYRFDRVADEWLDRKEAEAGSDPRKRRAYIDAKKLYTAINGLGAYFKRADIAAIGTDSIRGYLQFAVEHSAKGVLAPTTQRNHISALSGILKFAHEKRMIGTVPTMPKIRLVDNPRPYFNTDECRLLLASAGGLRRYAKGAAEIARWAELEDFLIFILSTFLRPAEWKELRQRHCRIVHGDHPYLEVAVPNGKTHKRKVVSMPEAIPVYQRILARQGSHPERYMFKSAYKNRQTALERMRGDYELLLDDADLKFDEYGRKRPLYSLRHTALMTALVEGVNVDLLMLSRNAGTGVDQLERFYLSHADAAMKVANLHERKPKPEVPLYVWPEPTGKIDIRTGLDEPLCDA